MNYQGQSKILEILDTEQLPSKAQEWAVWAAT